MAKIGSKTLCKEERISGTKRIEKLFSSGESFVSYPLRIVYVKRDKNEFADVAMMVSVPKKRFKRAVKRNRVKRLVREAFRLNKTLFWDVCDKNDTGLDIAFLYIKDELPEYKEIESAMLKCTTLLANRLKENKQK